MKKVRRDPPRCPRLDYLVLQVRQLTVIFTDLDKTLNPKNVARNDVQERDDIRDQMLMCSLYYIYCYLILYLIRTCNQNSLIISQEILRRKYTKLERIITVCILWSSSHHVLHVH